MDKISFSFLWYTIFYQTPLNDSEIFCSSMQWKEALEHLFDADVYFVSYSCYLQSTQKYICWYQNFCSKARSKYITAKLLCTFYSISFQFFGFVPISCLWLQLSMLNMRQLRCRVDNDNDHIKPTRSHGMWCDTFVQKQK